MDKGRTKELTVDKFTNSEDAKRFLLGLGLQVSEDAVKQVVNILSGRTDRSLYSLYVTRPRKPAPICGKGTAYKIKRLYNEGKLEPYLAYLSQGPTVGEAESEQLKEAKREAPTEEDLAKKLGVGEEKARPSDVAGAPSPQFPESKHPLQVLVGRDVLELAATFNDDLSRINALDDAVWQLLGAPWLSSERPEKASVLHVLRYPEFKVILAIEHDHPGQFLLLIERLEAISPGFEKDFRAWEHQSLTPFIRRCQEITREIWYQAESNEWGLKMGVEDGYGYMRNVPLFIYMFALEHGDEGTPPEPELELHPVDLGRFPGVPPHYQQLIRQGDMEFILAVGLPQVMNSCGLFTTALCKQYAQDERIRKIIEEEKKLKKQTERFRQALSQFLGSCIGKQTSQATENLAGARALEPGQARQLIQRWRMEVQSLCPAELLQWWLDEARSVAVKRFYTDENTERLYVEAVQPHFETFDAKRLSLRVESDPAFGLLQQKFPTADVWGSLQAWGEQAVPYYRAFSHMLHKPESAAHSALDDAEVDNGNLSVFITRCEMERSYAVLAICDLLACGLAEFPSNVACVSLGTDLEKLRLRVSLKLSALTREVPRGGFSTGVRDICALDFVDPLEETRAFLNEWVKLQTAENSLEIALQELEGRI